MTDMQGIKKKRGKTNVADSDAGLATHAIALPLVFANFVLQTTAW